MESRIKMESTIITNIQYSIKVSQFAMKRESWKYKENKMGPNSSINLSLDNHIITGI
jgi:hypothetical protein